MGVVASALFSFLLVMSILGENHKSSNLINNFFSDLKDSNYAALDNYYSKNANKALSTNQETQRSNFILELSLLQHYGVPANAEYEVKTKRENFWWPLVTEPRITYKIKLIADIPAVAGQPEANYINNFFILVRENGSWKIDGINIDASPLQNKYESLTSNLKMNHFVSIEDNTITFNAEDVDLNKIGNAEKKVLIYNLKSILEKMNI